MEVVQKSKVEVWEIVNENVPIYPENSISGIFCIIRRKGLIGWGEWYYLHGVLKKANDTGFLNHKTSEEFVKSVIKKLKDNAKN